MEKERGEQTFLPHPSMPDLEAVAAVNGRKAPNFNSFPSGVVLTSVHNDPIN